MGSGCHSATRTCCCFVVRRTAPMWPAILRPGYTREGVVEEPMEPCSLCDLEPWVMAPRL